MDSIVYKLSERAGAAGVTLKHSTVRRRTGTTLRLADQQTVRQLLLLWPSVRSQASMPLQTHRREQKLLEGSAVPH